MANPKKLITWENYQKDLSKSFGSLFRSREFTDVTISCENRKIEAHKFLLAASSPFFEEVFVENPCDHPVMVLKNVNYDDVFDVICYIYQGHISIDESREESFLQTAELLAVPVNNVAGCSKVTGKTLNKDSVSVRQFKQHKESHEQNTDDDDESDTSTDAQNHDDDDDDDSYLDGLFEDDNNEEYDERPRNLKQLPTIKLKNIASKEIVIDKNERLKTKKKLINAQLHIDKVNKKVNRTINKFMHSEKLLDESEARSNKPELSFLKSRRQRGKDRFGPAGSGVTKEVDTNNFLSQIRKYNETGSNSSVTGSQNTNDTARRSYQTNNVIPDQSSGRRSGAQRRREQRNRAYEHSFKNVVNKKSDGSGDAAGAGGAAEDESGGIDTGEPIPMKPRRERKYNRHGIKTGKKKVNTGENADPDAEKYNFYR